MKSLKTRSKQSIEFEAECKRLGVTPDEVFSMCWEAWPAFNDQPAETRGRLLGLMMLSIEMMGDL